MAPTKLNIAHVSTELGFNYSGQVCQTHSPGTLTWCKVNVIFTQLNNHVCRDYISAGSI